MNDKNIAEALGRFATGNLCNAHPDVRAMEALTPLFQGARVAGPAKTAQIRPGQNAALHRAVHTARPGEVLVVDTGGDQRFGPFGDILATGCRHRGITGLVIDGTIRDSGEIRRMHFPVFCRGTNPSATAKTDPGEIDVEIHCAGVRLCPGDFVVGDEDGVVVIPQEIAVQVVKQAGAVVRKEDAIIKRLAQGETTLEIFGMTQLQRTTPERLPMSEQEVFNFNDLAQGIYRKLGPGLHTRIFAGDQAMLSFVRFEPNAEGEIHSHPEEQWGVLLEGSGVRIQGGEEFSVKAGDFWRTPSHMPHGFKASHEGARVLDIFAPPREAYRKRGAGFAPSSSSPQNKAEL